MPYITFENPSTVAAPIGAYSHVAKAPQGTELIFLAGQVGLTPDGALSDDVNQQFGEALRNIVRLLESQGCTSANLVKVNTYLVEPIDLEQVRGLRRAIFGDAAPASTLVYVPRLVAPQFLVEIEAIAARPAAG